MTAFTLRAEFLSVFVFLVVTSVAIALRILVTKRFMAFLARCRHMLARQGKARQAMVETRLFPRLIVMTLLAFLAFLALVFVILFVAAETVKRRIAKTRQILVTRVTFNFRFSMGIAQNEFGLVVIKASGRCLPIALDVAIGAFLAQVAGVLVILLVAGETLLRRFFEKHALMAFLAFGLEVLAQ